MRSTPQIHCVTLGLLLGLTARVSAQAKPAAASKAAATANPVQADSLYSGRERDFTAGKTIYLRSSKTRIGVIQATDSSHAFPKSFPAARMKAVLIRRSDGPLDWVPVEQAARIYVVNKQ